MHAQGACEPFHLVLSCLCGIEQEQQQQHHQQQHLHVPADCDFVISLVHEPAEPPPKKEEDPRKRKNNVFGGPAKGACFAMHGIHQLMRHALWPCAHILAGDGPCAAVKSPCTRVSCPPHMLPSRVTPPRPAAEAPPTPPKPKIYPAAFGVDRTRLRLKTNGSEKIRASFLPFVMGPHYCTVILKDKEQVGPALRGAPPPCHFTLQSIVHLLMPCGLRTPRQQTEACPLHSIMFVAVL